MNVKKIVAVVALLFAAGGSQAAIVTYTGNTSGGPTYTRALADGSGLSAVGVGVRYNAYSFTVGTAGNYSFLTTGLFDTFTFLYTAPFSAASPLPNFLEGNDDLLSPPFTTSGFIASLTAGTLYTYITTGFAPADAGLFSTTIGGPGTITAAAVPLPAAAWLLLSGIAAAGAVARRRQARLS